MCKGKCLKSWEEEKEKDCKWREQRLPYASLQCPPWQNCLPHCRPYLSQLCRWQSPLPHSIRFQQLGTASDDLRHLHHQSQPSSISSRLSLIISPDNNGIGDPNGFLGLGGSSFDTLTIWSSTTLTGWSSTLLFQPNGYLWTGLCKP